jgi:ubiquinone/menaquinone biosynthesis C-methylase UbiE
LDHCLSLERSLREMTRVIRPGGKCLLWIGSNPGAPEYHPESTEFVPADQFHLFHFDIYWFEPMIAKIFEIVDSVHLEKKGYSHVIYCLVKRR